MKIGSWQFTTPLMLAPMAGVTDWPYREICRELGADYAVGEMTSSQPQLRETKKSSTRWVTPYETGPKVVQLLGAEPLALAQAAKFAQDQGADVIDINMGCPAKKVLQVACGSALLKNEALVEEILHAVVDAVSIPVTLKTRTGWNSSHKNVLRIGEMAQACGIQMLVVHGRTREDGFHGEAEYETIESLKARLHIPVIANGDINSPEKALEVLKKTQADGLMIGRAVYGNPWIFRSVKERINDQLITPVTMQERCAVILRHLNKQYEYYGDFGALGIRKHLRWYLDPMPNGREVLKNLLVVKTIKEQVDMLETYFASLKS